LDWELAWDLAFGSALELGIWNLGFDALQEPQPDQLCSPPDAR